MTCLSVQMAGMGEKRVTMQVDLPPDLQESLREFCRRSGRIQKEVVSQVLRWFLSQQGVVRRVALNDVDAGMESDYADALEELARQVRATDHHAGHPKPKRVNVMVADEGAKPTTRPRPEETRQGERTGRRSGQ